ncbi:MAG: hypothetical protein JWR37_729 [Mycobacterium sp.]|nr:hypothetical protein [Mycobacterium sp.]
MSLDVHIGGLHDVAASLAIAAEHLSALAAAPLIHPPLAADEVSTSAAARLTAHAGVLGSRAADGAAVLQSGAQAVLAASLTYADMNAGNASLVGLHGDPGGVSTAAPTPAVVADLVAPFVPITPPVPRDGEVTAAIMEAGNAGSGAGFVTGCDTYATAFRGSASAARNAQSLVSEALTGQAGPRIAAALGRFGGWSDAMAEHATTVGQAAQGHKERFQKAKQDTPTTTEFADKRQEYANAQALNARHGGIYSGVVAKVQGDIVALQNRAGVATAGYHLGELPAAPPPPPAVVPIVSSSAPAPAAHDAAPDHGSGQPDTHRAAGGGGSTSAADGGDALAGDPTDPTADPAAAGLGQEGNPAGDPASQMIPMIASMVPAMLGGVVGLAASIPQQIGQQVQSLASGAMQGVQGLTTAMHAPDATGVGTSIPDTGLGDLGATGDSGGGGDTTPAAAPSTLPPASGAMGAPAVTPAPLVGQTVTAADVPGAAAGAGMGGGMPMMMPGAMGAGGSGGTRPVKEPDKSVYVPPEPNSAAVRGEVARRETAVADDPTAASANRKPVPAVTVSASRGRRIELPKEGGGDE